MSFTRIAPSSLLAAASAALSLSSLASADFVNAQFTGTGAGQNVSYSVNGQGMSSFAGQLHYTLSGSTGPTYYLNGQWTTFCTEVAQHTNGGSLQYEVMPVADLPTPGDGMGAAKADLIARLYGVAAGAQFAGDNTYAAAFQLAIWEIVHDFDGSTLGSLGLGSGIFTCGVGGAVATQVTALLSAAFDATSGGNIVGIGNNSYQDQILELPGNVPGPGALALGGLVGMMARATRRRSS